MANIRLRMTNTREIRRALTRVSNMVMNGELDTKRANTIILGCNTMIGVLRLEHELATEQTDNSIEVFIHYGDESDERENSDTDTEGK